MDIYKITNVLDGKIYVGKAKNYKDRFNNHRNEALRGGTSCPHLYAAMRKYGVERFICEKIDESFTEEDLCRKEIFWIEKLDARNPDIGYNIAKGGHGGINWPDGENAYSGKTDEERKLISEKKSKSLTGKKRTDEQKKHYSESKTGDKNPMKQRTGDKHHNYGKKCYTSSDGSESRYYVPGEEPDSWEQKMHYNLTVNRSGENNGAFGRHWYNNGEKNAYTYECPEGYVKGMLKKK